MGVTATAAAVPVPVKLIVAVPFVEALLEIVSCPSPHPQPRSNDTFTVVAWFGVSATGNAGADTVKLAPVSFALLIVTDAVPVEVNVMDFVVGVLMATLPNARLVGLILSATVVVFSCSV